jgi:hypothetical protein
MMLRPIPDLRADFSRETCFEWGRLPEFQWIVFEFRKKRCGNRLPEGIFPKPRRLAVLFQYKHARESGQYPVVNVSYRLNRIPSLGIRAKQYQNLYASTVASRF